MADQRIVKRPKSVLCIIDVQSGKNAWPGFVDNIIREITTAKKRRAHIVVVEYTNGSAVSQGITTTKEIMAAIGRTRYSRVVKTQIDGGDLVLQALKAKNIEPREVLVVGQSSRCCVVATVKTLRKALGPERVTVVPDCSWPEAWKEDFVDEPSLRQQRKASA